MTRRSVVVVGAGIGGLTAAIHLQQRGLDVTVVEQHDLPGGRCGRWEYQGHRFDTGPTLLVMPDVYEAEFGALGSSVHERLDLRRVDPTYRLVFDDGTQLMLTADRASMREQLEAIEPGSFDGMIRYLRQAGRNYDLVVETLVNRAFRRPSDALTPRTASLLFQVKPLVSHYRSMGSYFKSPRLKSAFTFQDLYVGLSPFDAPSTFSMLAYSELAHGVWYPAGGMYSIVEALADLARHAGVTFAFRTTVARISTSSRRARGVTLADGSQIGADVVLANADLPYVYRHLLPDDGTARSLERKEYSASAISFFWGLDRPCHALRPHTLFLADDYRENFEAIGAELGLAANPSLYVHAPTRLDSSMAPPGGDSVTAIIPVGHLSDDGRQDWDELRELARDQVMRRLASIGVTDFREHVKFDMAYTPMSWARQHNLTKGSTHGLSHKLTQMAFFRPSNRHRRYRNLYFVGASTHPGTGVPMAMVSGRHAAERIVAELR
jgi:phytoene desaturase